MNKQLQMNQFGIHLVIPAAAMLIATGAAAIGAMPRDVQEACQRNASDLNPLSLKCSMNYVRDGSPVLPERWFEYTSLEFHWADGKFYVNEMMSQLDAKGTPVRFQAAHGETTFDGKSWYLGDGGPTFAQGRSPGLLAVRSAGYSRKKPGGVGRLAFPLDAGYWFPRNLAELGSKQQSLILKIVELGGKATDHGELIEQGVPLRRIEVVGPNTVGWVDGQWRYDFRLDPKLGLAVRELNAYQPDGELALTVKNSNFKQLPSKQVWFPHEVHETKWPLRRDGGANKDEPAIHGTFKVIEIASMPVADDRFVLSYPEGAAVSDYRMMPDIADEDSIPHLRLPADKAQREQMILDARRQVATQIKTQPASYRGLVIGVNIALIVAIAFWIAARRRSTAS